MTLATNNYRPASELEVTLDEIISVLSRDEHEEFAEVLSEMQRILDSPSNMVGSQALISAARLSALRTKVGLRAQYYKTCEKTSVSTNRKNLLLTMYSALEENINTMKLLGRIESGMVR